VLRAGEEVFKAQCSVCHAAGVAGAPKFGDAAAWAPRIKTGDQVAAELRTKGKGAMFAQGGGEYADAEIGRAVVYMANAGGAEVRRPGAAKPAK
jgi:cytochrome c5